MNDNDTTAVDRPLIQLTGVAHGFGAGAERVEAVTAVDLQLQRGESVAVVGPSGCGKTTLLLLLAGLLKPQAGTLNFQGAPLAGADPRIALVLQHYGLFPWKTVAHNVELGFTIRRERGQSHRVAGMLATLGIADKAAAFPGQLSGGQQQRVALARALVLAPELLLLDEPFAALDTITRERLQDLVHELWRVRGFGLVIVTHNLAEAVVLGQRILVVTGQPGRITGELANPGSIEPGYRDTPEYTAVLQHLRSLVRSSEEGGHG